MYHFHAFSFKLLKTSKRFNGYKSVPRKHRKNDTQEKYLNYSWNQCGHGIMMWREDGSLWFCFQWKMNKDMNFHEIDQFLSKNRPKTSLPVINIGVWMDFETSIFNPAISWFLDSIFTIVALKKIKKRKWEIKPRILTYFRNRSESIHADFFKDLLSILLRQLTYYVYIENIFI